MRAPGNPVIIGVGQVTFRDRDPARTPVEAMATAARLALADAAAPGLAEHIDCLVTIPSLARQVPELAGLLTPNPGDLLARRLGLDADLLTADYGGNLPQWFVNRCADALAAGEHRAVLISGGELMATLLGALRSGADLSGWQAGGERPSREAEASRAPCLPAELAHGLFEPVLTYPLFESALRHARGLDEAAQLARLGRLVSAMSEVAAANPHAWKQEVLSPADALSTDGGNRVITWPYTKCMNAIAAVDMAAAVLLTTDGLARELGIDPRRLVYLQGGAEACDVWYTAERQDFHSSPALRAAAGEALAQAGTAVAAMDHFDLYSCFPVAVEIACDAIGIASDDPRGVTVTGGLGLFGGPGNNYSLHAIAEVVERLRRGDGDRALVTACGGYLTKHAVGVYGNAPGPRPWAERDPEAAQRGVDRSRHPRLAESFAAGPLTLEAHAVRYGREGPATGVVVGRLGDGRRCLAHSDSDPETLARLAHRDCVGVTGHVSPGDPVNRFSFAPQSGS
jgi:acetyl-CoA C-acetyltransferase